MMSERYYSSNNNDDDDDDDEEDERKISIMSMSLLSQIHFMVCPLLERPCCVRWLSVFGAGCPSSSWWSSEHQRPAMGGGVNSVLIPSITELSH